MTDERLVAIHQPNFLPWLGWFDKLARADVFVLLDSVQFPKKAGTWINRTQLVVNGDLTWATIPVVRSYRGVLPINEMRIDDSRPWRRKLLRTIEQNYRKARYFDEMMPVVSEVIQTSTDAIADYNEVGLRRLADVLGLDWSRFVRSSGLAATGTSTDLLVALTTEVGGTAYLVGGGAGGYQEDDKFAQAGLRVVEQGFKPMAYPQLAPEFRAGASVVDALMNCGPEDTAALLARA
jgi:hypothetical protein